MNNHFLSLVRRTWYQGSGTASADMIRPETGGLYSVASVKYIFGPSPAPTPEPATVFLFGAGIAFVARAARNRFIAND